MTKVSVIIPNYNGNGYLKDCLDSLMHQTYSEFETIIVDNGSTDSSYRWVEEYKDITFKRLNQNYGFSRAINEGIYLAEGEYVLLLNNDTILDERFLEEMVIAIEKHPKIFGVSSKMIAYHNHQIMDDAGDEYTILGWTLKRGDGKGVTQYTKDNKVFSACAGAALYRKKVFEEIGYFDEVFFAYMEDVDIGYRARIYGYHNVYCPKAKVYHIGSATSGSRYNAFKVRLAARNNIYVPYKNMPLLQLVINGPFLLLGILIKNLWFSKKGFGNEYREGIKEGFKGCKRLNKVTFHMKNLFYYIHIEILMFINMMKYIGQAFKK